MPSNLYRRGGTWYARFQVGKRQVRRSLQTDNRKEAESRLKALKAKESHAAFYGEERHTWAKAAGRFFEEVAPGSLKPSTITRYAVSAAAVDPFLGEKYVDEITVRDIAAIANRKGVTNATRKRDLTAVAAILKACCGWGWRDDNPAKAFDLSLVRERRDPITLPPDDHIEAMIAECGTFAPVLRLAWQTGMRLSEILSLEWRNIDLPKGGITIERSKTDSPRVIPLGDPVCRGAVVTISGTARHMKSRLVFWHGDGQSWPNLSSNFGQVRRRLNRARKKAGMEPITFRFHDLRHKFAVDYLHATRSPDMKRGDVYRLAEILGHSSVKTTEGYLRHVLPLGTKAGTDITVSAQAENI